MVRKGAIYAIDMGANCRHGNVSSSCGEYVETEAAKRSTSKKVPFPGMADVGGLRECKYGDDRRDKLLKVKRGKFYGHSNLQRAAMNKRPGECRWIDPNTGLAPPPSRAAPPRNYEHSLATVKSAMTGLTEYGSNLFCGRLRNNLIMSQYKAFGVWRAKLNNDGEGDTEIDRLARMGGLRVEENVHGDLLFPNQNKPGIFVLRPKVSDKSGLFVTNALPVRHGHVGGSLLTIGGWGFKRMSRRMSVIRVAKLCIDQIRR